VPDVDAAVEVVRAAGGAAGGPADREYGRTAECVDDQGVPFAVLSGGGAPVDPPVHAELRVPDTGRARAFYGTVLGWGFAPGHEGDFWNATIGDSRTRLLTGLSGGHDPAVVVPTWTVPDLDAAVAAVRAAGGTASEPRTAAYGVVADCLDDQGMALQLLSDRYS
jgi:predicted enzyme related to lactoylglutathione lyase